MRLFIAILFSPAMQKALLDVSGQLKKQSLRGNFTHPENLHLTLAFLGETENSAEAIRAMENSVCAPFDIALDRVGCFDDLWWAGIRENEQLSALAKTLHTALRAEGFVLESRRFKPHITLARQLAAKTAPHISVPATRMKIERISLMVSERIHGRLTYREIGSVRLKSQK